MAQKPVLVPTASLHGKVALVTGGSRGIGRGIVLELASRGCSVIVNYAKNESSANEVVKIVEENGTGAKAIAISADITKVAEIERLFQQGKKHFDRIDIVVSNSGTESFDETGDVTEEHFDYVYGLNARAQFFIGQAAWKYLENNGRLMLMSTVSAGKLGIKNHALYSSSKMAVQGLVASFATDFGSRGITVNGIAPGGIKSDMFTENAWRYIGGEPGWPAEKVESIVASHCPLKRCGVPQDIARVISFLASEDGGWINGQTITIAGGSGV